MTTVIDRMCRLARLDMFCKRIAVSLLRSSAARGSGSYDADGHDYLDLLSGIGVASLGHAHQGLADAIADQANTLVHTSNLFFHPLQGQVAERLAALSGLSRSFICNSGTEARRGLLEVRPALLGTPKGEPRAEFIALEDSFHGRTFGALSVTSDEHYRKPFEPLVPGVRWVPANDPDALLAAVSNKTAAIIVEGIQGEGGVRPLTPAFAAAINKASDATGALVIADEIQCGLGRTGHPFHFATLGLKPHLVLGRESAGRRRAGRSGDSQRRSRTDDFLRRPRQHVWREPARLPCRARVSWISSFRVVCSHTSTRWAASSNLA